MLAIKHDRNRGWLLIPLPCPWHFVLCILDLIPPAEEVIKAWAYVSVAVYRPGIQGRRSRRGDWRPCWAGAAGCSCPVSTAGGRWLSGPSAASLPACAPPSGRWFLLVFCTFSQQLQDSSTMIPLQRSIGAGYTGTVFTTMLGKLLANKEEDIIMFSRVHWNHFELNWPRGHIRFSWALLRYVLINMLQWRQLVMCS